MGKASQLKFAKACASSPVRAYDTERSPPDSTGLAGDSPAEPIVRDLLAAAVNRLEMLCATMLRRSYPRLARPPVGLHADEMLGAVVERLLKAMRQVRPQTVRQFFALASQHMRWELNDLARRLDQQSPVAELRDSQVPAPADSSGSRASVTAQRILRAIESLPEEEREAFNLVRVQGMTQPEAAEVLGVAPRTVKRRLDRARLLLVELVSDLDPASPTGPPDGVPAT